MYYIFSLILRATLYPYLLFRASSVISPRLRKYLASFLLLETTIAIFALLLQLFVEWQFLDQLVIAGYFVFFSLMYASGFVMIVNLVLRLIRRYKAELLPSKIKTFILGARVIALGTLIVFFSTMYVGYHNVIKLKLVHKKHYLKGFSQSGKEHHLRIGLMADTHIGAAISNEHIDNAVELLMNEKPDLILVAGDYVDNKADYLHKGTITETMKKLKAKYGVYFALGNHEYRGDVEENIRWVREDVGANLLRDSLTQIDSLFTLIGRDDYVNQNRPMLEKLTKSIDKSRPTILFEHTPHALDSLVSSPVDIAFYGHTHAGQVWPVPYLTYLIYGAVHGSYQRGNTEVYITSGVGAARTPYRLGTQSEIVIYDLYW